MSLLNCKICQRGRVSRVTDTELVLLISHLIQPPALISGVGWVRCNQRNKIPKKNQENYFLQYIDRIWKTLIHLTLRKTESHYSKTVHSSDSSYTYNQIWVICFSSVWFYIFLSLVTKLKLIEVIIVRRLSAVKKICHRSWIKQKLL